MEIWQLRRTQNLPWERTFPVPTAVLPPLTGFSEADTSYHAQIVRRLEITPPLIPRIALGSWAIDHYGALYHLREYALDDPRLHFPEGDPYGHFIPCRSEEHTSELQSHHDLVCRLLLEK